MESCERAIEAAEKEERRTEEEADEDMFGHSQIERIRRMLWNLLEYPESSTGAKVTSET